LLHLFFAHANNGAFVRAGALARDSSTARVDETVFSDGEVQACADAFVVSNGHSFRRASNRLTHWVDAVAAFAIEIVIKRTGAETIDETSKLDRRHRMETFVTIHCALVAS
jgi:hypothetical protein